RMSDRWTITLVWPAGSRMTRRFEHDEPDPRKNSLKDRSYFFFVRASTLPMAARSALFSTFFFTDARWTLVAPRFPQTPLQGWNAPAPRLMNVRCCSEVSLTMPQLLSG